MSHLYLRLESYGGTTIDDACKQAVEVAKRTGVHVWFTFNGVDVLARDDDSPEKISQAWEHALRNGYSTASDRSSRKP